MARSLTGLYPLLPAWRPGEVTKSCSFAVVVIAKVEEKRENFSLRELRKPGER
jgi:hypothetical protein